ncbi:hypothetical protein DVH05_014859 [Phytophthora capsici]|nr:hypothetical protein DVH05_027265 [Phytophthora capsici]KAG1698356.1 hypothetical protein DVH05_014859 [Phytophthora capsici]
MKEIKTTAKVNEVLDVQTELRDIRRKVHVNSMTICALQTDNDSLISGVGTTHGDPIHFHRQVYGCWKKKRKRMRKTWGPGAFPTNIKALSVNQFAEQLQENMQELGKLQSDQERTDMGKEELQAETDRICEKLDVSLLQGNEMRETLVVKEHATSATGCEAHDDFIDANKEQLIVKIHELNAAGNSTADNRGSEKSTSTECIDGTEGSDAKQDGETETQGLRLEVEQLAGNLAAVKLELAKTKKRLEASLSISEESNTFSGATEKKVQEVPLPDDQNADTLNESLKELYNALTEEFERITGELESVRRERDDYLEELRALESQMKKNSDTTQSALTSLQAQNAVHVETVPAGGRRKQRRGRRGRTVEIIGKDYRQVHLG